MQPHVILRHTALRTGHSPGEARVAESLILAESRSRDSARLGQPWLVGGIKSRIQGGDSPQLY